jgi:hypothetical protein
MRPAARTAHQSYSNNMSRKYDSMTVRNVEMTIEKAKGGSALVVFAPEARAFEFRENHLINFPILNGN